MTNFDRFFLFPFFLGSERADQRIRRHVMLCSVSLLARFSTTFSKKRFMSYVGRHFQDIVLDFYDLRKIFRIFSYFFQKRVLTRRRTFAIMALDNHRVVYPFFFSPFRAGFLRKADA